MPRHKPTRMLRAQLRDRGRGGKQGFIQLDKVVCPVCWSERAFGVGPRGPHLPTCDGS